MSFELSSRVKLTEGDELNKKEETSYSNDKVDAYMLGPTLSCPFLISLLIIILCKLNTEPDLNVKGTFKKTLTSYSHKVSFK